MTRTSLWLCCLIVGLIACCAQAQRTFSERWNFVSADLSSDAGLNKFLDLLKQSKDAGCTHALMGDSRWLRLADNADYLARVAKVKALAKELNLQLVPSVYAFGYSGRYLGFDPNLGVGMPVRDMVYVVQGKKAVPDPAEALDTSDVKGEKVFKVRPFSYYRVSVWTKEKPGAGEGGESNEVFRVSRQKPSFRWLTRTNTYIKRVGDRWLSSNTFNTLDAEQVRLQVFVKDYQELKIEPAGALLILRRDTLPLKVTSEDGQTVFEEGKDFKKLVDPNIAKGSGDYDSDHPANDIELTENSRIKDGQKLKVSFYHAYKIYADQNMITMEDPKVFEIMEKDMAGAAKVWDAPGYFMNYDEIRIGGWEPLTLERKITPGQLLAEHTRKGYDLVRKYAPQAKVYTWEDMYSPYHNAKPLPEGTSYYLVNGTWAGSWEGFPKDIIVVNWLSSSAEGMKFFADRGHAQILAGYYDARDTARMKNNITNWMKNSQGLPNILGFMYTTWKSDFHNLKEYFQLVGSYDQWSGQKPETEKEPGVPD